MSPSNLQLGATFVIAMGLIELVKFIVNKFSSQNVRPDGDMEEEKNLHQQMCSELKLMNSNHLHSIEMAIKDGNEKIVNAITEMRLSIIEKLK